MKKGESRGAFFLKEGWQGIGGVPQELSFPIPGKEGG